MDDPAVSAKQLVKLAKKHIEDQQSRIVSATRTHGKVRARRRCSTDIRWRAFSLSACRGSLLK
jgi:hypothetical protein